MALQDIAETSNRLGVVSRVIQVSARLVGMAASFIKSMASEAGRVFDRNLGAPLRSQTRLGEVGASCWGDGALTLAVPLGAAAVVLALAGLEIPAIAVGSVAGAVGLYALGEYTIFP